MKQARRMVELFADSHRLMFPSVCVYIIASSVFTETNFLSSNQVQPWVIPGIVDQMVWFRENWYEEVLRQLRQGLAKCYVIAFDNRQGVQDATITPHTLNFMKKLVSTFGNSYLINDKEN